MESKVAKEAEQELMEATQRLTPEERLNAFLVHCQWIMGLHQAGAKMRAQEMACLMKLDGQKRTGASPPGKAAGGHSCVSGVH